MFRIFFALLLVCFTQVAQGQVKPEKLDFNKFRVQGSFLEDSIQIGLSVFYTLSIRYPAEVQITFPDQKYNYGSFELIRKHYFNTSTQDNIALDSVLYELRTFEIDKIHELSLPVFVIPHEDTLSYPVFAQKDSVILKELITKNIQQLEVIPQTGFQKTKSYFNYPLVIGIVLLVIVFFLVVWGILGERFRKYYSLFQFKSKQFKFLKEFSRLNTRILREKSVNSVEQAITLWKKHMEFLEEKPFSTYTSKEISQMIPNDALEKSLRDIDRAIYGKDFSEEIESALRVLESFSTDRFEKKYSRLRNV